MAQIIEYTQQTLPSAGGTVPRARATPQVSALGLGGQDLAQGLETLAAGLLQHQEREGAAWTASAMSQLRVDTYTDLQEQKAGAEPNAPGFTLTQTKRFDEYAEKALANAPNDSARRFMARRIAEVRDEFVLNAMTFESSARVDWQKDQFKTGIENLSKLMATDPSQYKAGLAELMASIDASGIGPIAKTEFKRKAIDDVSEAAIAAQLRTPDGPQQFLDSVGGKLTGKSGNQAFDALPFDKRVQLYDSARRLAQPAEAKRIADTAMAEPISATIVAGPGTTQEHVVQDILNSNAPQADKDAAVAALNASKNPASRDVRANLAGWIKKAEDMAEKAHPGDPVFRDLVVSQVKGHVNTMVAAQEGLQRANHETLMLAAMGQQGGPKPLTLDQLLRTEDARQAWAGTDPQQQRGILAMLEHNAKEAEGTPVRSNSVVVEDLFRRIHLPPNDPNKIRTPGQLTPFFGKGINRTDYDWLKKEMDEQQTPEGQRLNDTRNKFFSGVKAQFDKSTLMNVDEKGGEDFYKFQQYGYEREREMRASGKNPYDLYDPSSADYLGKKVPAFQRTLKEKMDALTDDLKHATGNAASGRTAAGAIRTPLPPEKRRLPGETIDQYRKRVGLE